MLKFQISQMLLAILFDVHALATLAIQHVGSHETESATIGETLEMLIMNL